MKRVLTPKSFKADPKVQKTISNVSLQFRKNLDLGKNPDQNDFFQEIHRYLINPNLYFIGHGDSGGPLVCSKAVASNLYSNSKRSQSLFGIIRGGYTDPIFKDGKLQRIEIVTRFSYPLLKK
jgi:hypothetical protein